MKNQADKRFRLAGFNTQGDFGPFTMYTAADKGLVVFLKAPPRCPPTPNQIMIRTRFKRVGAKWRAMTPAQRVAWELLSMRSHIRIQGYALFTYCMMRHDADVVITLEDQTGVDVYIPPFIDLEPE
jgi:hypothetical protein